MGNKGVVTQWKHVLCESGWQRYLLSLYYAFASCPLSHTLGRYLGCSTNSPLRIMPLLPGPCKSYTNKDVYFVMFKILLMSKKGPFLIYVTKDKNLLLAQCKSSQFNSGIIISLDLFMTEKQRLIMQLGYLYIGKITVIAICLLLWVIDVPFLTHIYTFIFLNWSGGPGNIQIFLYMDPFTYIRYCFSVSLVTAKTTFVQLQSAVWLLRSCLWLWCLQCRPGPHLLPPTPPCTPLCRIPCLHFSTPVPPHQPCIALQDMVFSEG